MTIMTLLTSRFCIGYSFFDARLVNETALDRHGRCDSSVSVVAERRIIMPSPVRIYAGTQEGLFVWRSKNGSWEKVSVAFESGTIDSVDGLKAQPNVVFLGVTQDGLYRTDDAGKS